MSSIQLLSIKDCCSYLKNRWTPEFCDSEKITLCYVEQHNIIDIIILHYQYECMQ